MTHSKTSRPDIGQAIVIIAMGFVILLAFTGIVVDVARVFVQRGNLRRAVDAAGLSATGQFRQGATGAEVTQAAINLIRAHGITDPAVVVETCNLSGTTFNPALCPPPGKPGRKLVHVKAQANVNMLFLQLIGIPTVSVAGESTAEAAAVDAVLVLDTSESQAYDPPSGYAWAVAHGLSDPASYGCKDNYVGTDNVNACIAACNDSLAHPCYPLQKIKDAAKQFVDRLYFGYDRIAVIAYDRSSTEIMPMGIDLAAAKLGIDGMRAHDHFGSDPPGTPCPNAGTAGLRWTCGTSNPGGGLLAASLEYGTAHDPRPEALWVAILLSSGGLNATNPMPSDPDLLVQRYGYCPPKDLTNPLTRDNPPLCRDQKFSVHHTAPTSTTVSPYYDAEDYAFDIATFMGKTAQPDGSGGMGMLMFAIALGQKPVCTTGHVSQWTPNLICDSGSWNPAYEDLDSLLPNTGELFLRYVADIGDDGKVNNSGGCDSAPSGAQCGNYYFAPTGDDLLRIFLEIAGRIFTRIAG